MSGSGGFRMKSEGEKDSTGSRCGLWKFTCSNYGLNYSFYEINYDHGGMMHGRWIYMQRELVKLDVIKNYDYNILEGESVSISEDGNHIIVQF